MLLATQQLAEGGALCGFCWALAAHGAVGFRVRKRWHLGPCVHWSFCGVLVRVGQFIWDGVGALGLTCRPGGSLIQYISRVPGQRLRGATGGGCSKEGRTWAPQPTCLEGAVLLGGWTPTYGGRARASAVLRGLAREHEMFGANRAAGLSCGQRRLPRRGDTKDLSGWPSESPSATPPSLSSRDSM